MGGWFTYRAAEWAESSGCRRRCRSTAAASPASSVSRACPTLMFFGGQRPVHPDRRHREGAGQHHGDAVVVYPGADHGFMRDGSESYDAESAADAWSRMLAFFGQHLG